MTACAMCETPLREGSDACRECGTHTSLPPTPRAGPGQVRVALDAVRRGSAAEEAKGADISTPRRLLEAADRAEAEGNHTRALDLARAAKRAVEIAHRRSRVGSEIAHAEVRLREARESGLDVLRFERNLELANQAAADGRFDEAETLLTKASVKALEIRRERHFQGLIERATRHVALAKQQGGDVSHAETEIGKARASAAAGAFGQARRHLDSSIERAEDARRYSRAESYLVRAHAEAEATRKMGADTSAVREILGQAREALRKGVFAEVQKLVQLANVATRESRRLAQAEAPLKTAERELRKEERRGGDIGPARSQLDAARGALASLDFGKSRGLTREAIDLVKEAAQLRKITESLTSLSMDSEDLRKVGADPAEFDRYVKDAKEAAGARDVSAARRLVQSARHAAESSREAKYREVVRTTIEAIVSRAGIAGIDAIKARELLQEVESAVAAGQNVDVQRLVEERLATKDLEEIQGLTAEATRIKEKLLDLRRSDIDVTGAEEKIAAARAAVDGGRYEEARRLLSDVDDLIRHLWDSLRASAEDILSRAKDAVEAVRQEKVPVPDAVRILRNAEEAFAQGKYHETLEFSRIATARAERALQRHREELSKLEEGVQRLVTERIHALRERMDAAAQAVVAVTSDFVDTTAAKDALAAAQRALEQKRLEEAEAYITAAEDITRSIATSLRGGAEKALEEARASVDSAREQGLEVGPVEDLLAQAEEAMAAGDHVKVLQAVQEIETSVETARKTRAAEEQRRTMERAKKASERFLRVRKLLEELRKADIDIAGAEDGLKGAERAIQRRNFEEVDLLLADIEETARALKTELTNAAKELIERARARIEAAKGLDLETDEAWGILINAEAYFQRGDYDDAVEFARVAEKRAEDAIRQHQEGLAAAERARRDTAKGAIDRIKKLIDDLSRADIEILGAKDAVSRAEHALEEKRYEDVHAELATVTSDAVSVSEGLKVAADDLVAMAQSTIDDAKSDGFQVPRAEHVLLNARDAISDQRYVEAIEYKKVIEDIVLDARRQKAFAEMDARLSELKKDLEAAAAAGVDVRTTSELLRRAEEDLRSGRFGGLEEYAHRIAESLVAARKQRVQDRVAAAGKLRDEGASLGMDITPLTGILAEAKAAADAGDSEAVDRLVHDVEEKVFEHKRAVLLRRAAEEIDTIQGMVSQAERVGMEIDQVRELLERAEAAVEAGDAEGLDSFLTQSKSALEEARLKHFADRYESKLRGIQTMIESAKRVGANVAEAERILHEAEDALKRNDLSMADILVKQAEISTGIQVQNFIKNRYPNLVLTLPTKGLQANVWNKYVFEVENKGKLSARDVDIQFQGDVDVKGLKPIPEIGVDEKKLVEVGLKPKADGDVPLGVQVFYKRYFDENRYELKDQQAIRVEHPGTYIVEDVFLIHTDGRLIAHQSRKFREEIDEDIFSGMLTVVQEFVKDSFRQRTRVGLKRLDFGDSLILIERSPHTFLACVLIGDEPALLPLYMIEVLKEIEEKFGTTLEKWSGMLHEVQGVDDDIKKLIFVTQVTSAEMGPLRESPVTVTAQAIQAARRSGQDVSEVEDLLAKATDHLERDLAAAWAFINEAKEKAKVAEGRVRERMEALLTGTQTAIDELRTLGADVSQAELLLRDAREAFAAEKYDRVQEITENVRGSLDRAKSQVAARKVETDLARLVSAIREGRAQGVDVREAESLLTRIEDAIQKKDYRRLDEYLKRANDSIDRNRKRLVSGRAKDEMDKIAKMVAEAKEFGADSGDAEHYLRLAEKALQSENVRDLEALLDRARIEARQRIELQLKDRYPRLFLGFTPDGLQADAWNRVVLEIANKGNWAAKDLDVKIVGDFDVSGLEKIPKVDSNERRLVEFGVRPRSAGASGLDVAITYHRPLDEMRYEVTDNREMKVEASGTYSVTDALLFHRNGALLAHEGREFRKPEERAAVGEFVEIVRGFLGERGGSSQGLLRTTVEGARVLVEPGPSEFLVAVTRGKEPSALPLFMLEVMKEIDDAYGSRLEGWAGDPAGLEGLSAIVRKLVYVTDAPDASLGPLSGSPMARAAKLAETGGLTGEGGQDFMAWARSLMENEPFSGAVGLIDRVQEALATPATEIARQVQEAAEAGRATGTLEVTDEQMSAYVEVVRRVLEAIAAAKAKAGIERYWPVKRVAVKPATQLGLDAVTAFRKIIVAQSLGKELDIVGPNDTWRGMKVQVQVDRDVVSAAYKLWARKIEVMLKSQDPWKIKQGLARDEYVVGIDGQRVRIDPNMVRFAEALPDNVILEEFDGGVVYLDAEMTQEILGEGYAKELVNIIKDIRKDLNLGDEAGIETRIRASEKSLRLLRSWRDYISRETNSTDVQFVQEQLADGYIVEANLGEENFLVSVKASEA